MRDLLFVKKDHLLLPLLRTSISGKNEEAMWLSAASCLFGFDYSYSFFLLLFMAGF